MTHRIIFSLLMSFQLSVLMTAWITWMNLGFTEDYVSNWFNAWILAWPAAAAISFAAGPKTHKLATNLNQKIINKKASN